MSLSETTNILLADDDEDDCLLFSDALAEVPIGTSLKIVHDGEALMRHLHAVSRNLPDILFLDLNMPRKKGFDCLLEIKRTALLKKLPVVIYSTSCYPETTDLLYGRGAQYYICKPSDFEEVKSAIHHVILKIRQTTVQPPKEAFLINKSSFLHTHH